MTSTGIFMRRAVARAASFHWLAVKPSISPDSSAATKTPVPAADNQLIVKRAASGFAVRDARSLSLVPEGQSPPRIKLEDLVGEIERTLASEGGR